MGPWYLWCNFPTIFHIGFSIRVAGFLLSIWLGGCLVFGCCRCCANALWSVWPPESIDLMSCACLYTVPPHIFRKFFLRRETRIEFNRSKCVCVCVHAQCKSILFCTQCQVYPLPFLLLLLCTLFLNQSAQHPKYIGLQETLSNRAIQLPFWFYCKHMQYIALFDSFRIWTIWFLFG